MVAAIDGYSAAAADHQAASRKESRGVAGWTALLANRELYRARAGAGRRRPLVVGRRLGGQSLAFHARPARRIISRRD